MKRTKRVIPVDTEITKYCAYKNYYVFGITQLDNGKVMLKIVHCWDDGEIMNFGWDDGDGITKFPTEQAPNPRHIVKIFTNIPARSTVYKHVKTFLEVYYPKRQDCAECCVGVN